MDVTQTTQTPISTSTAPAVDSAASTVISSDFETFLKMLTTQLENQDPLDPVKSEDFAVQLATFSGVEQQVLTNDLLESLTAQMGLSGMGQYAGWVGMEVKAPVAGNFSGSPLTLSAKPQASSDKAILVVQDVNGRTVGRVSIPVSTSTFEWDGTLGNTTASDGLYSFSVESYSKGKLTSTDPVELYTRVTEAQLKNGETVLVTDGGVSVNAAEVTALREVGG